MNLHEDMPKDIDKIIFRFLEGTDSDEDAEILSDWLKSHRGHQNNALIPVKPEKPKTANRKLHHSFMFKSVSTVTILFTRWCRRILNGIFTRL